MRVINTRPHGRHEALTVALQDAGHEVITLPLLDIQSLPVDAESLKGRMQAGDTVVVISPTAVEALLAGLQPMDLSQFHWVAVGQGTAHLLRQQSLTVVTPETETSEGLLALPDLQPAAPDGARTVWIMRGRGGRPLLSQTLLQQGVTVHLIEWYERTCPIWRWAEHQDTLSQADVLIISSGEAWKNWQICSEHHLTRLPKVILVLGERTTQQIKAFLAEASLMRQVIQLDSLASQHIVAALEVVE